MANKIGDYYSLCIYLFIYLSIYLTLSCIYLRIYQFINLLAEIVNITEVLTRRRVGIRIIDDDVIDALPIEALLPVNNGATSAAADRGGCKSRRKINKSSIKSSIKSGIKSNRHLDKDRDRERDHRNVIKNITTRQHSKLDRDNKNNNNNNNNNSNNINTSEGKDIDISDEDIDEEIIEALKPQILEISTSKSIRLKPLNSSQDENNFRNKFKNKPLNAWDNDEIDDLDRPIDRSIPTTTIGLVAAITPTPGIYLSIISIYYIYLSIICMYLSIVDKARPTSRHNKGNEVNTDTRNRNNSKTLLQQNNINNNNNNSNNNTTTTTTNNNNNNNNINNNNNNNNNNNIRYKSSIIDDNINLDLNDTALLNTTIDTYNNDVHSIINSIGIFLSGYLSKYLSI
jgi:hypothetical protein